MRSNTARLFVPIEKIDEEKQEVWGVLAEERVDKSDEIFDYAGSKPYFEAWNAEFSAATKGKSVGNLRVMHQPIVAGKIIATSYDDDAKKVRIGTKVVDTNEWAKVKEGVYTGFSLGGKYVKRWDDTTHKGVTRYIAQPREASLVDNPCMYGAQFEAVKANGATELRKFHAAEVAERITEVDGKFVVKLGDASATFDTHDAALARLRRVESARKGLAGKTPLQKSLYCISRLADLLASMEYLHAEAERQAGLGDPDIGEDMVEARIALADALVSLAEYERDDIETEPDGDEGVYLRSPDGGLKKVAAGNAQAAHDHATQLGAVCATKITAPQAQEDETMNEQDISKLADAIGTKIIGGEAITKVITDKVVEQVSKGLETALAGETFGKALDARVQKAVDAVVEAGLKKIEDATAKVEETAKKVDAALARPAAAPGVKTVTVTKATDTGGASAVDPANATPRDLIKEAQRHPTPLISLQ